MDKVLAIIPARCGSKGIPNKNIKMLAGKPLLAYAVETVKKMPSVDRIIVSTDSQEYADIAISYGAEVPFLRPAEFATDTSMESEFVMHLLLSLDELPEYIVYLQPPTPIRDPMVIEDALEQLRNHPEASGVGALDEVQSDAWLSRIIVDGYIVDYTTGTSEEIHKVLKPRQLQVPTYTSNGYFHIKRVSHFMKTKQLGAGKHLAYITPHSIDIDCQADFDEVERQILERKQSPEACMELNT